MPDCAIILPAVGFEVSKAIFDRKLNYPVIEPRFENFFRPFLHAFEISNCRQNVVCSSGTNLLSRGFFDLPKSLNDILGFVGHNVVI